MNFEKAQYTGKAASTVTRSETMAAFFDDTTVCSVWSGLVWKHGCWWDRGALVVVAREVGHAVRSVSVDQSKFPEVIIRRKVICAGEETEGKGREMIDGKDEMAKMG